jgi:hypothetical protein
MHNEPTRGPTRNDKTLERMQQERASLGATTAGGHEAERDADQGGADSTLSTAGQDLQTSNNSASRRDDVAAGVAKGPSVAPSRK